MNTENELSALRIDPAKTRIEGNCRAIRSLLVYFEKQYGRKDLEKFINETGMPLEYLEGENNWLTLDYTKLLYDKLVNFTGDPDSPFKAGAYAARVEVLGGLFFILRALGSPSISYKNIVKFAPSLVKTTEYSLLELKRNRAVLRLHYIDGFTQSINNCRNLQGQFASVPTVWGLPLAKVHHPKCQAKGDDSCVYEITWINKPSRFFGYYGLLGGAAAGWLFYVFNGISRFFGLIEELVIIFLLLLCGYLLGRSKDYMNIVKESRELYEGQNQALLNSIREIEEFNIGLQKKVEERTEELSTANQKLERTYAELKENETRLVQSEKMASLGRLIAGIAHEVNTPAGVIKSSVSYILSHLEDLFSNIIKVQKAGMNEEDRALYMDIMKKAATNVLTRNGVSIKGEQSLAGEIKNRAKELNLRFPEGAEKILAEFHLKDEIVMIAALLAKYDGEVILKSIQNFGRYFVNLRSVNIGTERISELVKALKVYSHLDQSKIEEVDIHEGIETSLTVLKNEMRGSIEVVKNFSVLPNVTCYVNELNQVWTNVILNACEALKGEGKITIETYEKDGMAAVRITDNGPGIPSQTLPMIFDPFFTTKPKGNGMGLGICRQIIDKHNGQINVESEPGRTSFEVVLPVKMKTQIVVAG